MSTQTHDLKFTCSAPKCKAVATVGLYRWKHGETDVNLNNPEGAFCGKHVPKLSGGMNLRAIKLKRT